MTPAEVYELDDATYRALVDYVLFVQRAEKRAQAKARRKGR